jgi:hypothetical protein
VKRWFFCLLAAVFIIPALSAQETDAEEVPSPGFFPLALVLEGAEYAGNGVWRPDWPLEMPPDAFKVQLGEISAVSVKWDGFSLDLRFGSDGLVEKFPLMLDGRIAQASLVYNGDEQIRELALTFPSGEDPWKMEFLEYRASFPVLVRAFCLDTWYFIYYSRGVNGLIETWYDEEGNFLAAFNVSRTEIGKDLRIRAVLDYSKPDEETAYYYDSRGFLTGISGPGGIFNVLYYRDDLPRYRELLPAKGAAEEDSNAENNAVGTGKFSLQWDETGRLLRIAGETEDTREDYRYEYSLDDNGNWVERRETRMIRRLGLLVPSQGITFKRVLEYRNQQ